MATLIAPERRQTKRKQSYEEYLALPDDGRIVEWVDGEIITHMPATQLHQNVASLIETLLRLFVTRLRLGRVFDAPFEVRLWPNGLAREPDVLFIGRERMSQLTERRFEGGPDLVVEVVSPGSVTIDRVDKFLEYERANVGEYWIIDTRSHQQQADFYIRDADGRFAAAPLDDRGVFTSTVLPGFRLDVGWLWQEELPDAERITAGLLAEAPGLSDELRALYREMARVLGQS